MGGIVGGVIGGLVAVAAVAVIGVFTFRYFQKNHSMSLKSFSFDLLI